MRIVFHGENAACFAPGIESLLASPVEITLLPDVIGSDADRKRYAEADVIVGTAFNSNLPRPVRLSLYQVPGAGYDGIDLAAVPNSAAVCNCFGHEQAIAEYVMGAILSRQLPFLDADSRLREGEWAYSSGAISRAHGEIAGRTIGLLGFGHIGRAIAARARAFEMRVTVANRSPVHAPELVDESFGLQALERFWQTADYFVISLPLTPETAGIVNGAAFAAMQPDAVVLNVGRGAVIDEQALFDALKARRVAGAVIDTWYQYPVPGKPQILPSRLPFQDLPNLVMTPHMSGWTEGTIRRRRQVIAENINRRHAGRACLNLVRAPMEGAVHGGAAKPAKAKS